MLVDEKGMRITSHRGHRVSGITPEEIDAMLADLKGRVEGYCVGRKGETFSIRSILGGENFTWKNSPLQRLYDIYENSGCSYDESVKRAGKAAGRLLKRAIIELQDRTFQLCDAGLANGYMWLGDHP